jgi:hypothetical protein
MVEERFETTLRGFDTAPGRLSQPVFRQGDSRIQRVLSQGAWPNLHDAQSESGSRSKVVRSSDSSSSSFGPMVGSSNRKKYRAAARLPS